MKTLKVSLLIILLGMIIPALLSVLISGFEINRIAIVNLEFFAGLIVILIGGIMITFGFTKFKWKLLRTPVDSEVEESKENKEQLNWPYILFCSGIVILLLAVAIGEL